MASSKPSAEELQESGRSDRRRSLHVIQEHPEDSDQNPEITTDHYGTTGTAGTTGNPRKLDITKRRGQHEPYDRNKMVVRLKNLTHGLDNVDIAKIVSIVDAGLVDNISTVEIDNQLAEVAGVMNIEHPDYNLLAGRILATNLRRQINTSFSANCRRLYENANPTTGAPEPVLDSGFYKFVSTYASVLDRMIDHHRDLDRTYFGMGTIMHMYLLKIRGVIAELPQFMYLRVAIHLNMKLWPISLSEQTEMMDAIKHTYDLLSLGYFTFGSPTFVSAGTAGSSNLASCVLTTMQEDSMDGIMNTLHDCAMASKVGSGIGLALSNIRARGSAIRGGRTAKGIEPLLDLYGGALQYADQGNTRPGSIAMYVEMWHVDVLDVLNFLRPTNDKYNENRNVFPALWISDLFMKRVINDETWSLMCPTECPGLMDVYGDAFDELYTSYESQGRFRKQMSARKIWDMVFAANRATGVPYLAAKDTANRHTNHKNLGVIHSSNLCTEIFEYHGYSEQYGRELTAVCNLATMRLPSYVINMATGARCGPGFFKNKGVAEFDFASLRKHVRTVVRNLNTVIDVNKYPIDSMYFSNMKTRPIGLGVQGLADVCVMLGFVYGSPEALEITAKIAETIYYGALEESCALAAIYGPCDSHAGSPASQGILHFDSYGVKPSCSELDWKSLRMDIEQYGLRNSLLIAWPPTATSSNTLDNNEGGEPFTYMVYKRETMTGKYAIVNKHLVADLTELGLWNDDLRAQITANTGSIQNIDCIPDNIKDLYQTAYELDPFCIVDMAAAAQPYVDQGISLNWYRAEENAVEFLMLAKHAHDQGLKCLKYYCHSASAAQRVNFDALTKHKEKLGDQSALGGIPDLPYSPSSATHDQDDGEVPTTGGAAADVVDVDYGGATTAKMMCSRLYGSSCEACSA